MIQRATLETLKGQEMSTSNDGAELRFGLMHILGLEDTEELLKKGISTAKDLPKLDKKNIADIMQFYSYRPWFRRMWPVQEVILSRSKIVYCGNYQLSWEDVGWFATWVLHKFDDLDFPANQYEGMEAASWVYSQDKMYSDGFPMATLLRMTRRYEASDPKDKLYGLLGMVNYNINSSGIPYSPSAPVSDEIPKELDPKSSKSKTELDVYFDIAKYLIRQDNSLEILTAMHFTARGQPLPVPSWVPRWNVREDRQQIWLPHASADNFSACSISAASVVCYRGSNNSNCWYECTVRGIQIGKVSSVIAHRPFKAGELGIDFVSMIDGIISWFPKWQFPLIKKELIRQLAMALTGGRADMGSIVVSSSTGSSSKTIDEHVNDFAALMLDLEDIPHRDGFRQLLRYLKDCGFARQNNARVSSYAHRCFEASRKTLLFRTNLGSFGHSLVLGLGPECVAEGDAVCILQGGRVPFVIRQKTKGEKHDSAKHQLVGECYVNGAMNKEFEDKLRKNPEDIRLV